MPSFPPRIEPIKKQNQLLQKKRELILALQKNLSEEKQIAVAEKYKTAQLSLLKAILHSVEEKQLQGKNINIDRKEIENRISEWSNKQIDQIIKDVRIEIDKDSSHDD